MQRNQIHKIEKEKDLERRLWMLGFWRGEHLRAMQCSEG